MKAKVQQAYIEAMRARDRAHAPYSEYRVGAALLLSSGDIVPGCNVENASYGATICAERNAICAAVARYGAIKPKALVLVTEREACPCGLCLQTFAEFCGPDFPIFLSTPKALGPATPLRELLPFPFSPEKLHGSD